MLQGRNNQGSFPTLEAARLHGTAESGAGGGPEVCNQHPRVLAWTQVNHLLMASACCQGKRMLAAAQQRLVRIKLSKDLEAIYSCPHSRGSLSTPRPQPGACRALRCQQMPSLGYREQQLVAEPGATPVVQLLNTAHMMLVTRLRL